MLHKLNEIFIYYDHVCWYYINTQWHCYVLDEIVPFIRNQWFWTPLYFFLILFMPINFKKNGWIWCLVFLISFGISDQISATILKPVFHRIRPCNNHELASIIRLLVPCGGGYSFPSSHASNHFAMGVFSAITLSRIKKWIWFIPLVWAMAVSFAQVYVGVHYPLDVIGGGLLGGGIGLISGSFFNRYFAISPPASESRLSYFL